MDVTKILEADNRHVEALFAAMEKAEGASRQPFVDDLTTSLRAAGRCPRRQDGVNGPAATAPAA